MGHRAKGVPSSVQLKREEQMKVPPEEMFRKETDKYSQFDEQASCCKALSGHLTASFFTLARSFIHHLISLKANHFFIAACVRTCS